MVIFANLFSDSKEGKHWHESLVETLGQFSNWIEIKGLQTFGKNEQV